MSATKRQYRLKVRKGKKAVKFSLINGLANLITISPAENSKLRYHHVPTRSALRGDMLRVGMDMQVVIDREKMREKTTAG